MFSNYKNFERLRYQLINDYSFIQDSKKPEEQFIESALFSGLLSVIVSYLFSDELSSLLCDCRIRLFIKLPVLILVYSILYFSFKYIFVKIVESYNNRRIHKTKGPQNIKSVKKDFDNIAVDSLIMAMGYKDNTDNATTESSVNKKELYIYEMIHYINQAQKITKQLFQLKDKCINRGELSEGIDGYRVRNAVNIMDELMKSVEKYVSDLQLTDQVLIDNINRINQTLDDLKVSVKDI